MQLELRTIELPHFVDGDFAYPAADFLDAIEKTKRLGRIPSSILSPRLTAYLRAKEIVSDGSRAWVIDGDKLNELIKVVHNLPDTKSN